MPVVKLCWRLSQTYRCGWDRKSTHAKKVGLLVFIIICIPITPKDIECNFHESISCSSGWAPLLTELSKRWAYGSQLCDPFLRNSDSCANISWTSFTCLLKIAHITTPPRFLLSMLCEADNSLIPDSLKKYLCSTLDFANYNILYMKLEAYFSKTSASYFCLNQAIDSSWLVLWELPIGALHLFLLATLAPCLPMTT